MVTNNSWNSQDPAQVARGGSGAATLTGVLTGNGTSAFTVSTVTDNTVVMGSTSNLLQDTTITVTDAGEMVNASQPCFLVFGTGQTNVTGNNTLFTVTYPTEITDQGGEFATNTYTATVDGNYSMQTSISYSGLGGAASITVDLLFVSSNRTYQGVIGTIATISDNTWQAISATLDLDAADTVIVQSRINGLGGDTADVASAPFTWFSGFLAC